MIWVGKFDANALSIDVTKCDVTSEILYFFHDNGADQEKFRKPPMMKNYHYQFSLSKTFGN